MPKVEHWYITEKGTDDRGRTIDRATRAEFSVLGAAWFSRIALYVSIPSPNRRSTTTIYHGPFLEESWAEFSEVYIWPDGRLGDDTRKVRIAITRMEIEL